MGGVTADRDPNMDANVKNHVFFAGARNHEGTLEAALHPDGVPPAEWEAGDLEPTIFVVDVDRTHPIMRYLELFSLKIVEGRTLTGPRGTQALLTSESVSSPAAAIFPNPTPQSRRKWRLEIWCGSIGMALGERF